MKRIASSVLPIACISVMSLIPGCMNVNYLANNEQETSIISSNKSSRGKYALIVATGTYRDKPQSNAFDGGTKNAFLITIADIYNTLSVMGYRQGDINILYHDGVVDNGEASINPNVAELIDDMSGEVVVASAENLENRITTLSEQVTENDDFVFVFMGNGFKEDEERYVRLYSPNESEVRLYPEQMLETIKRIKAGRQFYVIDACYSGEFGEHLASQGSVVFTSSSSDSPAILSREDQFSRFLFQEIKKYQDGGSIWSGTKLHDAFVSAEERRKGFLEEHKRAGHLLGHSLQGFSGQSYNLNMVGGRE